MSTPLVAPPVPSPRPGRTSRVVFGVACLVLGLVVSAVNGIFALFAGIAFDVEPSRQSMTTAAAFVLSTAVPLLVLNASLRAIGARLTAWLVLFPLVPLGLDAVWLLTEAPSRADDPFLVSRGLTGVVWPLAVWTAVPTAVAALLLLLALRLPSLSGDRATYQ